jgi:hypothetical protein
MGFACIRLKKFAGFGFPIIWKKQIYSREFIWLFPGGVVDEEPLYQFDKSRIRGSCKHLFNTS